MARLVDLEIRNKKNYRYFLQHHNLEQDWE